MAAPEAGDDARWTSTPRSPRCRRDDPASVAPGPFPAGSGRWPEGAPVSAAPDGPADDAPARRPTALVVDDTPANLSLLAQLLSASCQVKIAICGRRCAGDRRRAAAGPDRPRRADARARRLRGLPTAEGRPGAGRRPGAVPDRADGARGRDRRLPAGGADFVHKPLQPADRAGAGAHAAGAEGRARRAAPAQRDAQRRGRAAPARGRAAARDDAVPDPRTRRVPRQRDRQPRAPHRGVRARAGRLVRRARRRGAPG
ncbi:MAG: hypothetical protein MZW92_19415 [Comamonadaceae bacterium]|nr:hypothetical protein [Comamonadaceae bacterium]